MFIGHFGLGLLGKTATARTARTSLGTWFLAVQLCDLLWPLFLLLGWEHVRIAPGITRMTPLDFYDYPITHSLVGALGLGAIFAILYALVFRWRGEPGADVGMPVLMGLAVFSHWVLDLAVHRPDLPLLPHGPYVGLGLWNTPWVEAPIEVALYLAGVVFYLRRTRPLPRAGGTAGSSGGTDPIGRYGTWLLLAVLPAFWLAAIGGPPPSSVPTLAWMGMSLWLFPLWAWWTDRHRHAAATAAAPGSSAATAA
jgi:hypothetical protein